MKNPICDEVHKQTLLFLEGLLPEVNVTPDEMKELTKYGIDPKVHLISACVKEVINKLYSIGSQYHEYIDELVFNRYKHLFKNDN